MDKLKILLIAHMVDEVPIDEGNVFIRTLQKNNAYYLDYRELYKEYGFCGAHNYIEEYICKNRINSVMFCSAGFELFFDVYFFEKLRKNIFLVMQTGDTKHYFDVHTQYYAQATDLVIVYDFISFYKLREFGTIYWDMEEASFLRISDRIEDFYKEMLKIVKAILEMKGFSAHGKELNEIIRYQQLRIPIVHKPKISKYKFSFNIPEYFDSRSHSHLVQLREQPQVVTLRYNDFQGDKVKYAREAILWGRKSNKILVPVEWQNEI